MLSHSYLFAVLSLVQRQRNYAFAEQTNYATRGKTERSFKKSFENSLLYPQHTILLHTAKKPSQEMESHLGPGRSKPIIKDFLENNIYWFL